MTRDRVLTVHDYYDGPRLGIAELDGVPHIYEAEFDHSGDEYGDTYFLSPIEPALLELVLEDWSIWRRWEDAFKRREVPAEPHGALPADLARHDALRGAIGDQLKSDPENRLCYRATFTYAGGVDGLETLVVWRAATPRNVPNSLSR